MRGEYGTSSNFNCYINIVERGISSEPPTNECRYELGIHEFYRAMEIFSLDYPRTSWLTD